MPGAVSVNYLMAVGTLCGGWQMGRAAKVAAEKLTAGDSDAEFYKAKILSARLYSEQCLPKVISYAKMVRAGAGTIMEVTIDQLLGD